MKLSIEQHLLVCLNEEGVEIAKDADKALRFGIDDTNFLEPEGPNNRQKIIDELNDLMGVVELCVDQGIFPEDWLSTHKVKAKKEKVLDCMDYARQAGALE